MALSVRPQLGHSRARLTAIGVVLLVALGALTIILDRKQVSEVLVSYDWRYLIGALFFMALSYFCGSASFMAVMHLFGTRINAGLLMSVGLVSLVMQNLIAQPAGISVRLLLLGRQGISSSHTLAASVVLSYFKNLLYFSLIPISLFYISISHPLPAFGLVTTILIALLLIVLLVVATGIVFLLRWRLLVLRLIGRLWKLFTRRDIRASLDSFDNAIAEAIAGLKRRGSYRWQLAGFMAVDVAATIAALWFCFAALGIAVSPEVLIAGFNFGITLTIVAFIPGDLGVQEATLAGVFALFGVPFSHGVLAAILFRVVYYFVPFLASLGLYLSLLNKKAPAKKA